MSSPPRVSVIIPAYNAAWCIRRAVDSVLAQTCRDFELIVVNDGSQDDTANLLRAYGDALRVVSKPNGGLSSARNAGIRVARGEYIALLDADDYWLPEKLARQVTLMDANPDLVFTSTAAWLEDAEGNRVGAWRCQGATSPALEAIFFVNAFVAGSGSAAMLRCAALARAGWFDESLKSLEDIDMWMRLAATGAYACIEEPLTVILKRPGSMSGNLDIMRNAAMRVMKKNRHLLPPQHQGQFWRDAYAGMLVDYAKWEYRAGRRIAAIVHVLQGLALAPIVEGRLKLGLLRDMLFLRSL